MSAPPPRMLPGRRTLGTDWLLIVAIGTAMALVAVTWLAALASGILSHGTAAQVSWSAAAAALPTLATHPGDPAAAYSAADGRGVGGAVSYWACVAALTAALAAAITPAARTWRRRRSARDGMATHQELARAMSARRALDQAHVLRPQLAAADPAGIGINDVAVSLGRASGTKLGLWVPIEDSVAVFAPARGGKTSQLIIPQLLDWPGAALVTSARTDVLYSTALLRQERGAVHVLDPYDFAGWPTGVRWSLVEGCQDFGVAQRRTEVLVTTARSEEGTRNGGYFINNAKILLNGWLHAAALAELGGRQVLRWASSSSNRDPIQILLEHDRPDLARALASLYEGDAEEKHSSWKTAFQPLAGLLNPRVAEVFACEPAESLSLEEWLTSSGTIYLIGEEDDRSLLSPLLAAFGRAVMDTAKRRAGRSPGGRLDPPMALFGDEIANSIPLPELPKLMSLAGGFNIFVFASMQNLAQGEQRWGRLGVRQIFSNATVKIVLGGISDPTELKMFSDAIGDYDREQYAVTQDERRVSVNTSTQFRPILDPGMIRTVPFGTGVVIHRNTPAARTDLVPAHRGPHAQRIEQAQRQALALVHAESTEQPTDTQHPEIERAEIVPGADQPLDAATAPLDEPPPRDPGGDPGGAAPPEGTR